MKKAKRVLLHSLPFINLIKISENLYLKQSSKIVQGLKFLFNFNFFITLQDVSNLDVVVVFNVQSAFVT